LLEIKSKHDKSRRREVFFVNRTISGWTQPHEGAIGTSPVKTHTFTKRARKAKIREVKEGDISDVK
jgi:hypothetical protein